MISRSSPNDREPKPYGSSTDRTGRGPPSFSVRCLQREIDHVLKEGQGKLRKHKLYEGSVAI